MDSFGGGFSGGGGMNMEGSLILHDRATPVLRSFGSALQQTQQQSEAFGNSFQQNILNSQGAITTLGKSFLGAGVGMLTTFGLGVKNAMSLEQSIKNVDVALGGLNATQVEALTREMQAVGTASQYSATEVAGVAEALAKAGFAFEDVVDNHMTQAVIELASATGTDLNTAVMGVVQAMSIWDESVVGVDNALTDASDAADILTVAANQSSADVGDIIAGMRNLGPAAASVGMGFDEASAAVAMFTNYGIKGADAGVSLARGMTQLANPTAEARAEMDRLGIAAYDSQGNFVGLPSLFDQVKRATAAMTDEQRQASLSMIFGAEALDVMTLAAETGADPLLAIIKAMEEEGIAAQQAAERTNTLRGAFERASEGLGTFLGAIAKVAVGPLTSFANTISTITDAMLRLPDPVQKAIGALFLLTGAVTAGFGAFLLFLPKVAQVSKALADLGGLSGAIRMLGDALRYMVPPWLIGIMVALGAIFVAYRANIFGVRDAVDAFRNAWSHLSDTVANNALTRALYGVAAAVKAIGFDDLARKITGVAAAINAFFGAFGDTSSNATVNASVSGDDKVIEWIENPDAVSGYDYMIRIKNPDGSFKEFGQIMESYTDPDDPNLIHMRVKTEDGEYWTTYDDINDSFDDFEALEVKVDVKDARKNIDRVQDGLDDMEKTLRARKLPFFANLVRGVNDGLKAFESLRNRGFTPLGASIRAFGVGLQSIGLESFGRVISRVGDNVETFIDRFRQLRDFGVNPVSAALSALVTVFPSLNDVLLPIATTIDNLVQSFRAFREQGLDPIEAALMAVADVFPRLSGAMTDLLRGIDHFTDAWDGLIDALTDFLHGDWSSGFTKLKDAARDAWAGIQDLLAGLGELAAEVWDWTITVAAPTVLGWLSTAANWTVERLAAAAGWVWEGVLHIPSISVSVGTWLADKITNLWEWLRDYVWGNGTGSAQEFDETGGVGMRTGLNLGDVFVSIGKWLPRAIGNVWTWLRTEAIPKMGDALVKLGNVTVEGITWLLGTGIPNVWGWLQDQLSSGRAGFGESHGMGGASTSYQASRVTLGDVAVSVTSWVNGGITSVWKWLRDNVMPAGGQGLLELGKVLVSIAEWAEDRWESLPDWIRTKLEPVKVAVQSVAVSISDWIPYFKTPITLAILKKLGVVQLVGLLVLLSAIDWVIANREDLGKKLHEIYDAFTFTLETIVVSVKTWWFTGGKEDVDEAIEHLVGRTFVYTFDVLYFTATGVKALIEKMSWQDAVRASAALAFAGAVFALPGAFTFTIPLVPVLGAIALALLGVYIAKQVYDYFMDHPLEAYDIMIKIGLALHEIANWGPIERSINGWKKLIEDVKAVYDAIKRVVEWFNTYMPNPVRGWKEALEAIKGIYDDIKGVIQWIDEHNPFSNDDDSPPGQGEGRPDDWENDPEPLDDTPYKGIPRTVAGGFLGRMVADFENARLAVGSFNGVIRDFQITTDQALQFVSTSSKSNLQPIGPLVTQTGSETTAAGDQIALGFGRVGDAIAGLATLVQGVAALMAGMTNAITANIDTQKTKWDEYNVIIVAEPTLFATMVQGIAALMEGMANAVSSNATRASTALTTAMSTMRTSALTAMNEIAATVRQRMSDAATAVQNRTSDMRSDMNSAASEMGSAARRAGAEVSTSIRNGMSEASAAVGASASGWAGIIERAGYDMGQAGYSAGLSAADGVRAGIEAGTNAAVNAASSLATQVNNAINAIIKPGSPSKVTTITGESIPWGLAVGIRNKSREAIDAARALARQVSDAITPRDNGPAWARNLMKHIDVVRRYRSTLEDTARTVEAVRDAAFAPIITTAPAPLPVVATDQYAPRRSSPTTVTSVTILTIPPDEWVRMAQQAERGGSYAEHYSRPDAFTQYLGGLA